MKHVGKMKNNGAKVVVAYRTLPGDPNSALVVGTGRLGETYHDSLMNLVQESSGQQANELADILSVRQFPDGSNMLEWLHTRGHLKKVPTSGVLMTPTTQSRISLDELNQLIAEQKGVSVEDLAITDGSKPNKKPAVKQEPPVVEVEEAPAELSASELRSKADALFKQAQQLRKQADEMDPPKSKIKKVSAEA
jgi:hypothetical protein